MKNFHFIFIFLLCLIHHNKINAQGEKKNEKHPTEKMFHSIGTSVYLDIFNGPIREKKITATDPFGNTTSYYDYVRVSGLSYFTFIYHFRYNIQEFSDNFSFGASAIPSAGIFAGGSIPANSISVIPANFSGCFNLPLMAGFHLGASATNTSSSELGLFLGAGYEFNNAPMFYAKTINNRDIQTKWINPCVSLGLKYESNSAFGSLQEINLKIGLGLSGTDLKEPSNFSSNPGGGFVFKRPSTIRISYLTYLNY
jgi:hypothetical protein